MSSQRGSAPGTRRAPRLGRAGVEILAGALLMLLPACEAHPAGEACWSDFECQSSSCTFGTCDSDTTLMLGLAAGVLIQAGRRELGSTPSPPSSAPATRACLGLDAAACAATPGCSLSEFCVPPGNCGLAPDAGFSCFDCLYTGWERPCQYVSYCY